MSNTSTGSVRATNKLIPELRFPEFVNEGEWEENEMGSLIDIKGRIGYRGYTLEDIVKKGEGAISLSPSNIDEYGTLNFTKSTYITWAKYEESPEIILQNDFTVLVKTGSTFGKVAFIKKLSEKATINPQLVVLKPTNVDSFFLYLILSNSSVQSQIKETVVGGAIPTLSQDSISKFKVLIPPDKDKKEQQKIASCLSSLDEVIAAHSQKLEALKEQKKGLMQNLFPQEGEKVPKVRFKEFEKDVEWVGTYVEKNCLVKGRIGYRGYTTEDLVSQGEGALVLGGKHIQNQLLELKDPTYLSWEKYYESPEIMVEFGDIIFSQRGTLGDCAIIDREIGPATINPSMVLLKNITCDARFLYYILIGDRIQIEVRKNRAMGAIPMLSQKQIKEFPFLIPMNPKEQQKIASCLSSLDALITTQTEKIEQLKLHKKGLMQGLFPKIND